MVRQNSNDQQLQGTKLQMMHKWYKFLTENQHLCSVSFIYAHKIFEKKILTVNTHLGLIKPPLQIFKPKSSWRTIWTCHGNCPWVATSPPAILEFLSVFEFKLLFLLKIDGRKRHAGGFSFPRTIENKVKVNMKINCIFTD